MVHVFLYVVYCACSNDLKLKKGSKLTWLVIQRNEYSLTVCKYIFSFSFFDNFTALKFRVKKNGS